MLALCAVLALGGCAPAFTVMHSAFGRGPGSILALHPIEVRGQGVEGDTFVVAYSGDGGWGPADRGVSRRLALAGVPTVGVDSIRYFWTRRSADAAGADLGKTIEHYARAWNKSRVILIGYSFGAGAMPVAAAHLPAETRARVRLMALLAPGPKGELVLRPRSWFDRYGPSAQPLAPLLASLSDIPTLCVYGALDHMAACARLPAEHMRLARVKGGHHYFGQYAAVADAIMAAAGDDSTPQPAGKP